MPTGGPTLLGFDVIWIATILSFVATMAVLTAIYAATTVKDPMARRVKALNERREQLKAGIVASTNKRKKLTNRNQASRESNWSHATLSWGVRPTVAIVPR